MNQILEPIRAKANSILNETELQFADALLNELSAISLDERLTALIFTSSIAELNDEKKLLILEYFGEEALNNTELFRRISNITLPSGEKRIQSLRKVFIELSDDLKIIILKLYERLLNLKIAFKNQDSSLLNLAEECLNLYSPIAHRLGIRQIYNQMEDIAFQVLYPEDFQKLDKAIEKRRTFFEAKLKEMANTLKTQMDASQIECDIQFRVKRPYSIFKKLINQNIELNQIYDLMALRVITNKIDNCYLGLGIVHRNWIPIEKRFRDWVTFPKPNGYRSIQTTVITNTGDKFEIQIRTNEMHKEAEYGTAAHWAYKEKVNTDANWISRLKEFLENDEYFNNPNALDELLKSEAKRSYIHILTPKGEVRTIPEGSTVLDFANTIHTDVFYHCVGARINGKFAKLKTELKTGDIVEISTNKNSKPSRDWLKVLKSPGAKSKLVQWLKKNESNQLIADGKRVWEKFKKANKHKISGFDDETVFKQNLIKTGYKNADDFFAAIGTNSLKTSSTLLRKLYPNAFEKKKEKAIKEKPTANADFIDVIVEGLSNIEVKLAKCCHPIKGEPIVAYVTQKSGIKIHNRDCSYVNDVAEADRIKPAAWANSDNLQSAKVQIFGADYSKLLTAAVESAQSLKVIINNTTKVPNCNNFECIELTVQVKDIEHFSNFTKKLKNNVNIKSLK